MILQSFRRSTENRSIAALYGAIVAQARRPAFYRHFGVPDTLEGRFDLIVLHLVLVLRRLAAAKAPDRLGQGLFDRFCSDLDANLREMGVGDLAVPRRMRRFGEAFYGRQAAYLAALDGDGPGPFENALARNIFGEKGGFEGRAAPLAGYARAVIQALDEQPEDGLWRGEVGFPDPEAFIDARQ